MADAIDPELIPDRDALGAKIAEVIAGAEVSVALLSLGLSRRLYAREDVISAMSQAARKDRMRMRVLVADARAATAGGNAFVELARRLPSRVQMRELTPEKRESDGPELLIVDSRRMIELGNQARLEAVHYPHAAPRVAEKIKEFDALWDESEPVLELSGMRL
jgi:hypothetical protein